MTMAGIAMSAATATKLDIRFYDVDANEEDASYDRWFRAKVQEALDSTKPAIAHDEVVKKMALIAEARKKAHAAA